MRRARSQTARKPPALALRLALVAGLLSAAAQPAQAQGAQARVTIEADRHIAAVGEPMQVTVKIEVSGRMGYDRYLPPAFDGFTVAGGSMTSQNIEVVNWQVRRSESHTYSVTPLRQGTLTIGPAAVIMRGRKVQSPKLAVKVTQSASEADPGASAPDAAPRLQLGQPLEPVFLTAMLQPEKVYKGQQIVATWYLFTQSDILGFQKENRPTTDHFWTEDLRSPNRLAFEQQKLNERLYYAAVIERKALFPQRAGKLQIGQLKARVRTLDQLGAAAAPLVSERREVEVLPLPERGRPPGFDENNVGRYDVFATLDRHKVKAGEGLTLKLIIRGSGNLRQITPPALEALDGFKVYKPKVDERLELEGEVSGEKVMDYLLLPTRGGKLTIRPLHFDYFDPQAEAYRRASTQPLSVEVYGAMPADVAAQQPGRKNVLDPGIRPPRPARSITHRESSRPYRSPLFLSLLLAPVLLVVGVGGGERLLARLRRETASSLRRAASRSTRRHVRRAQELQRARDIRGFHGEIAAALRALLDHRLGVPIEGLRRAELERRMLDAGYSADLVDRVVEELDSCDMARFAPSSTDADRMGETLTRVRALLDRLSRVSVARRGR